MAIRSTPDVPAARWPWRTPASTLQTSVRFLVVCTCRWSPSCAFRSALQYCDDVAGLRYLALKYRDQERGLLFGRTPVVLRRSVELPLEHRLWRASVKRWWFHSKACVYFYVFTGWLLVAFDAYTNFFHLVSSCSLLTLLLTSSLTLYIMFPTNLLKCIFTASKSDPILLTSSINCLPIESSLDYNFVCKLFISWVIFKYYHSFAKSYS